MLQGKEKEDKNQWIMKYRSQWPTKNMRSLAVWNWTSTYLLDRARDIKQNHWTMKYRSHWPTNSMRSLTVSDWISIQSVMHSCAKSLAHEILVTMTYNNMRLLAVWNWTDAYILDRASDTRQNHWTMKDRSLRPTKNMSSLTVSDWTSIQSMMPSYSTDHEI